MTPRLLRVTKGRLLLEFSYFSHVYYTSDCDIRSRKFPTAVLLVPCCTKIGIVVDLTSGDLTITKAKC
jgi:hypothetical protein|eukprot:COSAG01_NODE_606_length_14864_cov_190.098327_15_plen_68_part_00